MVVDRILLAHALTASRLPIAIALTQTWGDQVWSAVLVAVAALTDTLDGTVARWAKRRGSNPRWDIGAWLDPVIDKLFVLIVLGLIAWHTGSVVLPALIAAREIVLVPVSIVWAVQGKSLRGRAARPLGKAATIVQFVVCAVAVVHVAWAWPLAIACAVLGVAAVVDYLLVEHHRPAQDPALGTDHRSHHAAS